MNVKDFYHIDGKTNTVVTVPYSRDRAMCVSPIFYASHRAANIALKEKITNEVNERVRRIIEIEKELAA